MGCVVKYVTHRGWVRIHLAVAMLLTSCLGAAALLQITAILIVTIVGTAVATVYAVRVYDEMHPRPAAPLPKPYRADIRVLPQSGGRVESGPVQFGDDWPGVFFRGDDAAGQAQTITMALDLLKTADLKGDRAALRQFALHGLTGLRTRMVDADLTGVFRGAR